MRAKFATLLFLMSAVISASQSNDELLAQKGLNCLKDEYSIFDSKNLQEISDKVNCREKVTVSKDNRVSNLDCPDNPIFESFLVSDYSSKKRNTCLRSDRNTSPEIFENINCACVSESLKNDYKDNVPEKVAEFKEQLKAKVQRNIGEKLKKKLEYIKNSEILLSANKKKRSCLGGEFFERRLSTLTTLYNCGSNSAQAISKINDIFGAALGIDVNPDSFDESLNNLVQGIKGINSLDEAQGKKSQSSCFESPEQMQRKFIHMKYNDKMVNLKASFGGFIKNRNLNSSTLIDDFNKYIKEKSIDLHPHIRSLAKNNLSDFLSEIDNDRSGKELTLNQLLTGPHQDKWMEKLGMANRSTCASITTEIAKTICSTANIAYDDPSLIETFLDDEEDFKVKNALNLKNLYCEKKDLHTVDPEGKLLVLKSKLVNNEENASKQDSSNDWLAISESIHNQRPDEAVKRLFNSIKKGIENFSRASHKQTTEKLNRLLKLKDFVAVGNADLLNSNSPADRKKRRSLGLFFKKVEETKKSLQDRLILDIQDLSKDVYKIKSPNMSQSEFTEKFVENYKDRRYTRNLTDSLESFSIYPEDEKSNTSCQDSFADIYCPLKKSFEGKVDVSCMEQAGSLAIIDLMNKSNPGNTFHNICQAKSLISSENLGSIQTIIEEQISSRPDLCSEVSNSGYSLAYARVNKDNVMGGAYFESHTGGARTVFQGIRDSENFIESNIVTENINTPQVEQRELNIIPNENKVLSNSMTARPSSIFSDFNYFKDSRAGTNSPVESLSKMNEKDFQDELEDKSNKELEDYIKELEAIIAEKESQKSKVSKDIGESKTLSPELEKLKKDLAALKEKSALVQEQLKKVEDNKSMASQDTLPVVKNDSFSNFTPVSPLRSEPKTSSIDEQGTLESDQLVNNSPIASQINQGPSPQTSGVSLTLNEQFDDIVSRTNTGGQVEITFNNETYKLEVSKSSNGEMVCKFADEDLNSEKAKELDEICKQYQQSLERLKKSKSITKSKNEKIKKKDKKEKKKRKVFKVEDLNKVLNN